VEFDSWKVEGAEMVRFVDPIGLSRGSQVPLYCGECLVASWASPSDCPRLEAASESAKGEQSYQAIVFQGNGVKVRDVE
jgi:hypothetical protein